MRIAVGMLGVGLALTACTGPGAEPAAPTVTVTSPFPVAPTADPAVLSWVDGFCSAINGYRVRNNAETGPPGAPPTTVAEAQKALSAQLGGIANRTGEVVDKLAALPAGPGAAGGAGPDGVRHEVHDVPGPRGLGEDRARPGEAGRPGVPGPSGRRPRPGPEGHRRRLRPGGPAGGVTAADGRRRGRTRLQGLAVLPCEVEDAADRRLTSQ